ncbi:MAG: hypothetical protein J6A96_04275 [Clostridia bacterium]|nr:hypothetical protein [Clostridia bacterium]
MDVYVIGNGFDLQHLLPTKYINFLNVVNFLISYYDKENMKTVGDVFSKLANGINPLDDMPVPENDIVNNVRLSRCFFYVSDILRQIIENKGITKNKRSSKIPFSITEEQIARFEYSKEPISLSEISKRIFAVAENDNMEKITYKQMLQWLIEIGLLYVNSIDGEKSEKLPTEQGKQVGIAIENRRGHRGEYKVITYNIEAQRFIVDNIGAIIATINK